jgi:hypothetical protein
VVGARELSIGNMASRFLLNVGKLVRGQVQNGDSRMGNAFRVE